MADTVEKSVRILFELVDKTSAGIKKIATSLKTVDKSADQAAKSTDKLGKELDNVSKKGNKLKNIDQGFKKLTKSVGEAGIALTAIGGAMVAPFAMGVKSIAQFSDTMAKAGSVSNATQQQMADMTEIAQKMGRETRYTASQAAEGLQFMSMAGFEVKDSIQALPGVLQLASAGAMDLGRAADITTNIMSGYGLQVEDMSRVNDVLVRGFTSANTNLEELGTAFAYAGPVAKSAGFDFEEVTAVLGQLANAGYKGEMGGTALRGSMTRLLSPTKKAQEVLDQLGKRIGQTTIEITNSDGKMKSYVDIIKQLEKSGITTAEAMEVFGLRAGPGMLALISQGSEALEKMIEKMHETDITTKGISDRMEETLGGAFRRLMSAVDGFVQTIVSGLEPAMADMLNSVAKVINLLTDFHKSLGPIAPILDAIVLGIGAFTLALGAAGVAMNMFGGSMTAAIGLLKGFTSQLTLSTAAVSKFNIALGVIGAAIAGISLGLIINELKLFENGTQSVGERVQLTFAAIHDMVLMVSKGYYELSIAARQFLGLDTSKLEKRLSALNREQDILNRTIVSMKSKTKATKESDAAAVESAEKLQEAADKAAEALKKTLDADEMTAQVENVTQAHAKGIQLIESNWTQGKVNISNTSTQLTEQLKSQYKQTFLKMSEDAKIGFNAILQTHQTNLQNILDSSMENAEKEKLITLELADFQKKVVQNSIKAQTEAIVKSYDVRKKKIENQLDKEVRSIQLAQAKNLKSEKKAASEAVRVNEQKAKKLLDIAKEYFQAISGMYGEDTKQYKKAQEELFEAQASLDEARIAQAEETAAQLQEQEQQHLQQKDAMHEQSIGYIEQLENQGTISHLEAVKRKTAAEQSYLNDKVRIAQKEANDAKIRYGRDSDEYKAAIQKKIAAEKALTAAKKDGAKATSEATKATEKSAEADKEKGGTMIIVRKGVQGAGKAVMDFKKGIEDTTKEFKDFGDKLLGIVEKIGNFSTNIGEEFQNVSEDLGSNVADMVGEVDTLIQTMYFNGKKIGRAHSDTLEAMLEDIEKYYDEASKNIDKLLGEQKRLAKEMEEIEEERISIAQNTVDIIAEANATILSGQEDLVNKRMQYDSAYAEANRMMQEGQYMMAKDYFIKAQGLASELVQTYVDMSEQILGITETTDEKIRSLQQGLMSDLEKWRDDRRQAEEIAAKAREAELKGEYELASQLYLKAQELAETLARDVQDAEGNTVQALEETTETAIDLVNEYGQKAGDALRTYETEQNKIIKETNDQALNQMKQAGSNAEKALDLYMEGLKKQQEINQQAMEESKQQILLLVDKVNLLADTVNQDMEIDIKTAVAEKALEQLTNKYANYMASLMNRYAELATSDMNMYNQRMMGALDEGIKQQQDKLTALDEIFKQKFADTSDDIVKRTKEDIDSIESYASKTASTARGGTSQRGVGTATSIRRAEGGPVGPTVSEGFKVPGFGLSDVVPALLTFGERVTNAVSTRVMDTSLPGFMESMNKVKSGSDVKNLFSRYTPQKFSTGGIVPKGFASGGNVTNTLKQIAVDLRVGSQGTYRGMFQQQEALSMIKALERAQASSI